MWIIQYLSESPERIPSRETAGQAPCGCGIAGRERLSRENEIKDGLVREEEPRQLSPKKYKKQKLQSGGTAQDGP